jgi:hypothetical protein
MQIGASLNLQHIIAPLRVLMECRCDGRQCAGDEVPSKRPRLESGPLSPCLRLQVAALLSERIVWLIKGLPCVDICCDNPPSSCPHLHNAEIALEGLRVGLWSLANISEARVFGRPAVHLSQQYDDAIASATSACLQRTFEWMLGKPGRCSRLYSRIVSVCEAVMWCGFVTDAQYGLVPLSALLVALPWIREPPRSSLQGHLELVSWLRSSLEGIAPVDDYLKRSVEVSSLGADDAAKSVMAMRSFSAWNSPELDLLLKYVCEIASKSQALSVKVAVCDLYLYFGNFSVWTLHQLAPFLELDNCDLRCALAKTLSFGCCQAAHSVILKASVAEFVKITLFCNYCDGSRGEQTSKHDMQITSDDILLFLQKLSYSASSQARVELVKQLPRIFKHVPCSDSAIVVCLAQLRDSDVSVRHALCEIIELFVPDKFTPNCALAAVLADAGMTSKGETASQSNSGAIPETLIACLGRLGRLSDDTELMKYILVGLLSFLCTGQPVQTALAFSEILRLARSRNLSPPKLFQPYLDVVSRWMVGQISSSPVPLSCIGPLFGYTANPAQFYKETLKFTLPYLFELGSSGTILELTTKMDVTPRDLLLNSFYLVSSMLVAGSVDRLQPLIKLMVPPDSEMASVRDWLNAEATYLVAQLVQLLGQDSSDTRVEPALRLTLCLYGFFL